MESEQQRFSWNVLLLIALLIIGPQVESWYHVFSVENPNYLRPAFMTLVALLFIEMGWMPRDKYIYIGVRIGTFLLLLLTSLASAFPKWFRLSHESDFKPLILCAILVVVYGLYKAAGKAIQSLKAAP